MEKLSRQVKRLQIENKKLRDVVATDDKLIKVYKDYIEKLQVCCDSLVKALEDSTKNIQDSIEFIESLTK